MERPWAKSVAMYPVSQIFPSSAFEWRRTNRIIIPTGTVANAVTKVRPLHNVEAVCKKSHFCSQLGGKAEFMNYK